MSGKIFINYRRGDAPDSTGRLYDRLEDEFAAGNLFMDVEGHIKPGDDFAEVLHKQVAQCDVLLAVIGPRWLELLATRAGDPGDFVAIEIKAALEKGKRVIPVLVGGAEMPRAEALPEAIRALVRRNAVGLRPERFKADCQGLISALKEQLGAVGQEYRGRLLRVFDHTASIISIAFSPDGRSALVGGINYSNKDALKLWNLATGKELRTFATSYANSVAFSPDGRSVLSSRLGVVTLWDVVTGKELRTFRGHTEEVDSVAFSPDGRTALSGSREGNLKLWDVATGKELRTFTGHTSWVHSVAFSPDGRKALSGSSDNTLKLWDVPTGKELHTFFGHMNSVKSVAFSPDGRTALSGGLDNTLKLWDVAAGKELRTFIGHSSWVASVALSPDGRKALSGSSDRTLKLWDVPTGKELHTFPEHADHVNSVAFSPDGRTALSGSFSVFSLWDVTAEP